MIHNVFDLKIFVDFLHYRYLFFRQCNNKNKKAMKVICAGFSKTGTKSLSAALTELGYEVYDSLEHFWYHEKEWEKIYNGEGSIDDFKHMYQNVDAAVDASIYFFWEEISRAFPNAKVITNSILCILSKLSILLA